MHPSGAANELMIVIGLCWLDIPCHTHQPICLLPPLPLPSMSLLAWPHDCVAVQCMCTWYVCVQAKKEASHQVDLMLFKLQLTTGIERLYITIRDAVKAQLAALFTAAGQVTDQLTHSLTHSLAHSLTHSPTHPHTHSLARPPTHPFTPPLTHGG